MQGITSFDGLSSGLNTTQIVDTLIQLQRRNAVLLEQEQASKTNIVTSLNALQAKIVALNAEAAQLGRKGTWEAASIKLSDDKALSATAAGRVAAGSYDLKVLSLARNHQLASQGYSDQSLSSFGTGSITLGVGAASLKTIIIDTTNNSLVGIKKAINDAKAGVTASIINDGSSSRPYRLILTAEKTGLANSISVTSALSGGTNPNFNTASFDVPERLTKAVTSTSAITLASAASFTGSTNKTYTFTIAGAGLQTIGSDTITINWSDGTNSGSIVATQADTEVELVGAGSDGLKLSFGSGKLNSSDQFQVQTFAPVLQKASDAKISVGSTGGSGSPITVTSATNTFAEAIGGLSLTVKKETPTGEFINITTDVDIDGIKSKINNFIARYNDVVKFVDEQNTYNKKEKSSGVLFGDSTLQSVQTSIRNSLGNKVKGLTGKYTQLFSVGIRTGLDGKLSLKDSARLDEALRNNLDEVINLFADSGTSIGSGVEYVASTAQSKAGEEYDVNVTSAAAKGQYLSSGFADPSLTPITLTSSNNRIKLSVNGIDSNDIVLTANTYNSSTQLITELQQKIDADEKIGKLGMSVSWVDNGSGTGYIKLESSTFGSNSRVNTISSVSSSALANLALATGSSIGGQDVAGTINGELADGSGQILTGKEKNKTTAGLKVRVTLTSLQLIDGAEASITFSRGVGSRMGDLLGSISQSGGGLLDRKIKGYESQVTHLKERVIEIDKRLASRRQDLLKRFYDMEETLGQLNSEGTFLSGQINNLSTMFSRQR
ncbi:MAG: flagellar filament capping protein FliD [candidate division Zixibacteria bacterium]|nr:flagellar filament capping protein FliD [candidate division Zixibacteria bacterium]